MYWGLAQPCHRQCNTFGSASDKLLLYLCECCKAPQARIAVPIDIGWVMPDLFAGMLSHADRLHYVMLPHIEASLIHDGYSCVESWLRGMPYEAMSAVVPVKTHDERYAGAVAAAARSSDEGPDWCW